MAKGIACPKCRTLIEGDFSIGETLKCSSCHLSFDVGYNDFQRYQVVKQEQQRELLKQQQKKEQEKVNQQQYEINLQNESKVKKITRKILYVIGALILVSFGFKACFWPTDGSAPSSQSTSAPERNADGTREGTQDDAKYFSSWDGSNSELVSYVKQGMKDPSSFEHVETRFSDKGDHYRILMTFRGKNSFNAVVTQQVTASLVKASRTLSDVHEVNK